MKEIKVFEQYPEIRAGFTLKGKNAVDLKEEIAPVMASEGRVIIYPRIVHSDVIIKISDPSEYEEICPGIRRIPDCDGTVTDLRGVRLTTTTGDCLAVFAYDRTKKVIGLAHAGWKGVLSGVPAKLIETMMRSYDCDPSNIEAWIGPGIGLCCFEAGADVAEDFWDRYPWAEEYSIDLGNGKYKLDLKGISLELLEMCGVDNAKASERCTCCEPEDFWSYRRCKDSDRMLQYIEIL